MAREVLAENIPCRAYDLHMLLCNMVALLYNKSVQLSGWSNVDVEALETLTWAHAVAAEEYYGLHICTENLEYSTHLCDDVKRHSSPDNYSCEVFERAIRVHKQQTHNAKGIERTLAERENIRLFLRSFELHNGKLSRYSEGKKCHSVDLDNVQSAIFFSMSHPLRQPKLYFLIAVAMTMSTFLMHLKMEYWLEKMAIQQYQQNDIKRHLQKMHPGTDVVIPSLAKCAKHVV